MNLTTMLMRPISEYELENLPHLRWGSRIVMALFAVIFSASASAANIEHINAIYVTFVGSAPSATCATSFSVELKDEDFIPVRDEYAADAVLEVTFSQPQPYYSVGAFHSVSGYESMYSARLLVGEEVLWEMVDSEGGDSYAEICDDVAEDIAEELEDER